MSKPPEKLAEKRSISATALLWAKADRRWPQLTDEHSITDISKYIQWLIRQDIKQHLHLSEQELNTILAEIRARANAQTEAGLKTVRRKKDGGK